MWQGIQTITDYKPHSTMSPLSSASLIDELHHFIARFDQNNKEVSLKAELPPNVLPLTSDVYSTRCKVNAWKAAVPDRIPGCVLKACVEQLAEVFTDIFNLSLVPTNFKPSTIVPLPKHSNTLALNDVRPVALTPIIAKCFSEAGCTPFEILSPCYTRPIPICLSPQ